MTELFDEDTSEEEATVTDFKSVREQLDDGEVRVFDMPALPPEKPAILALTELVEQRLATLETQMHHLFEKVQPILKPVEEKSVQEEQPPTGVSSISANLGKFAAVLERLASEASDIEDRVEL